MNLSRKTEKAFATYLPQVITIAGLNIYEGHEKSDEAEFPALFVNADSSSQADGMPSSTGIRIIRLSMRFIVDSEDQTREPLDDWKESLEGAMLDLPAIKSALNEPASGIDRRKVTGMHIHDVIPAEEGSGRENTDWVEGLAFDVVCEPLYS